jgi:hypothetical protein
MIVFNLPAAKMVKLVLYTLEGKRVQEIRWKGMAGRNSILLKTKDFGSGVYIYEIKKGMKRFGKGIIHFPEVAR